MERLPLFDKAIGSAARRRLQARILGRCLLVMALGAALASPNASAQDLPEYRLKAAFLYNFALFTEWPAEVGPTLRLCIHGPDPFGDDLEELKDQPIGKRTLVLQRKSGIDALKGCEIVFVSPPAASNLASVLEELRGRPTLTVADSPGAARQGVMLNMALTKNKVSFEANLQAARAARLTLSSKLLRLATEVLQ